MSLNLNRTSIADRNYYALKLFHNSYGDVKDKNHLILGIAKDAQGRKYLVEKAKKDLSFFHKIFMHLGCGKYSLRNVVEFINSSQFSISLGATPFFHFLQQRIQHHNRGQDGTNLCSNWRKVKDISLSLLNSGLFTYTIPETIRIPSSPKGIRPMRPTNLIKINECSYSQNNNATSLKIGDGEIILCRKNDISKHPADIIVNAANSEMLGGSGVDGAISKAGGKVLSLFRHLVPKSDKGRCPEGEVRLTDAGDLPAKICAHAVGPRFNKAEHDQKRAILKTTYRNTFQTVQNFITYLADKSSDSNDSCRPLLLENLINKQTLEVVEKVSQLLNEGGSEKDIAKKIEQLQKEREEKVNNFTRDPTLQTDNEILKKALDSQKNHEAQLKEKIERGEALTISFPTISTGVFGYPKEEGAWIALESAITYLQEHQKDKRAIKTIQIVFIEEQESTDVIEYEKHIKQIFEAWKADNKN